METVGQAVRAVCSEWEERGQIQMSPVCPTARSPAVSAIAAVPEADPAGVAWVSWRV